jgi:hypothetical protein
MEKNERGLGGFRYIPIFNIIVDNDLSIPRVSEESMTYQASHLGHSESFKSRD